MNDKARVWARASLVSFSIAAQRLGVSRVILYAWARQKRIPHYRLGRRVLFDEADLGKFLTESRVEPRAKSEGTVTA